MLCMEEACFVGKTLIRILAAALLLALLTLLVPSATPLAIGEELPVYTPVILEAQDVTPIDYLAEAPYEPDPAAYLPDVGGYVDPSLSVRVETMRAYKTTIQLTWVQAADATQLRTASYKPYPSKSIARAAVIAKREKAVVAINGDYFVHRKEGYIVRNGKICEPVRGASLVGKGSEVIQNIDMVGSDMEMGQGMCGSSSGSVPTNVGQPLIRVSSITVGGR